MLTTWPASLVNSQRYCVAHPPVGRQLGEAVGGGADVGGAEIAGKELVAGEAQGIGEVAVGRVGVRRIEGEVAVGVDVHAPAAPGADLRPAVDGEAGDEVAARLAVAAGEVRRAVGLGGVALAVQLVAGRIDGGCR